MQRRAVTKAFSRREVVGHDDLGHVFVGDVVEVRLSRYTHRIAISNSRLLRMDQRGVTFRVKNYRVKQQARGGVEARRRQNRADGTQCRRCDNCAECLVPPARTQTEDLADKPCRWIDRDPLRLSATDNAPLPELQHAATRAALAQRKRDGTPLGNPTNALAAAAMGRNVQITEADRFAASNLPVIEAIRATGITSLRGLAAALNARGIPTARGGQWHVSTVRNVLGRSKQG